jgi:hypothetical protein
MEGDSLERTFAVRSGEPLSAARDMAFFLFPCYFPCSQGKNRESYKGDVAAKLERRRIKERTVRRPSRCASEGREVRAQAKAHGAPEARSDQAP